MKKTLGGALAFALALSACGGQKQKNADEPVGEEVIVIGGETMAEIHADSTQLIWIRDNADDKLMSCELFADAPASLIDSLGLSNGIPSSIGTFLLKKDGHTILFDTGNGVPDSRLLAGLESLGLSPADIDYLFLTHFHGDHIGGMMQDDSVVFPKAEVYASRMEYDAWMQMPDKQKAQVVKTMNAYKANLHLFEFGDTLPGGVVAMEAVGHTPGHTVYQAGRILIVGDLMHGVALQKEHPEICASFDMDKEAAISTRVRILNYARDNELMMVGMHFPSPGIILGK